MYNAGQAFEVSQKYFLMIYGPIKGIRKVNIQEKKATTPATCSSTLSGCIPRPYSLLKCFEHDVSVCLEFSF